MTKDNHRDLKEEMVDDTFYDEEGKKDEARKRKRQESCAHDWETIKHCNCCGKWIQEEQPQIRIQVVI